MMITVKEKEKEIAYMGFYETKENTRDMRLQNTDGIHAQKMYTFEVHKEYWRLLYI